MGARNMEAELQALRSGQIDANEFVRKTEQDWQRMAKVLHGRWPLPPSVDEDDIRQEMLLAAFEPKPKSGKTLLEKWDPERQTKLSRYVVFNAHADVAKRIHRAREAHKRKGTEESRFALPLSSLGLEGSWWTGDDTGLSSDEGDSAERVEGQAEARALLRRVARLCTRAERLALGVLLRVEGDEEEAARRIEASLPLSLATGVGSVDEALQLVQRVMARARDVAARDAVEV